MSTIDINIPDRGRSQRMGMRKFVEIDEAASLQAIVSHAFETAARNGRSRLAIANAVGVQPATLEYYLGASPDRAMPLDVFSLLLGNEHVLGPEAHAVLVAGMTRFMHDAPHGADADTLTRRGCLLAGSAGAFIGLAHDVTSPDSDGGEAITQREQDHLDLAAGDVISDTHAMMGVQQ